MSLPMSDEPSTSQSSSNQSVVSQSAASGSSKNQLARESKVVVSSGAAESPLPSVDAGEFYSDSP